MIYLVWSDGGATRELSVGKFNLNYPSWGPNDHSLTFSEVSNFGHGPVRTLNHDTMAVTALPSSDGMVTPLRSPDARYLVATNVAQDRLLLFDFSTQTWSQLTEAAIGHLEWSFDGKFVYFDNGFNADPAVYRIRLSDQKTERIVGLKDFRRAVRPWSTWFGLTPDSDILLMRDTGSQEVYALDLDIP